VITASILSSNVVTRIKLSSWQAVRKRDGFKAEDVQDVSTKTFMTELNWVHALHDPAMEDPQLKNVRAPPEVEDYVGTIWEGLNLAVEMDETSDHDVPVLTT
jgi:hypothetical protein